MSALPSNELVGGLVCRQIDLCTRIIPYFVDSVGREWILLQIVDEMFALPEKVVLLRRARRIVVEGVVGLLVPSVLMPI